MKTLLKNPQETKWKPRTLLQEELNFEVLDVWFLVFSNKHFYAHISIKILFYFHKSVILYYIFSIIFFH